MNKRIDFSELNRKLLINAESYLRSWFPKGRRLGSEFVIGNLRGDVGESLSINLREGVWMDFSSGEKGSGLLSLYTAMRGIGWVEAARELEGDVPEVVSHGSDAPARYKSKYKPDDWEAMPLAPHEFPEHVAHYKRGIPSKVWHYRSVSGRPIGMVCRFDLKNGGKEVIPYCWCKNKSTEKYGWRWKAFFKPRPIYGLELLWKDKEKPILIVEGEKAADAARLLTSEYTVISWPGGGKAVDFVDWKPVAGRDVYIWPDNDAAGFAARDRIRDLLLPLRCAITYIETDWDKLPAGFDAADIA